MATADPRVIAEALAHYFDPLGIKWVDYESQRMVGDMSDLLHAADAVIAALSEAGWGPTAAHESCIKRLLDVRRPEKRQGKWFWMDPPTARPCRVGIPMTPAEQEVMSREHNR